VGRVIDPDELCRRVLARPELHHVAGAAGSGAVWLAATLLRQGAPAVLLVTAETDGAHRAHADARYLLEREGLPEPPVLLLGDEGDAYAPTVPDRRAALVRQGALCRLALGTAHFAVSNASTLVRKLPPKADVLAATPIVRVDHDLDTAEFRAQLSAAGYVHVPVVEDPGSLAVRGGLIDVWGADAPAPVRIELFGDAVLSIREFDPDSQRTTSELREIVLPPARDAIMSQASIRTAEARLRALCDQRGYPSLKTRQLVEDVTLGRQSFGVAAYLPAFHDLAPVWEYLPAGTVVLFEEPTACKRRLLEELEHSESIDPLAFERPQFDPSELYQGRDDLFAALSARPLVATARSFVLGAEGPGVLDQLDAPTEEPPDLGFDDHSELLRAVQAARTGTGRGAALDPVIDALRRFLDDGLHIECVVRSATQAQRLSTLLEHRDIPCLIDAPSDEGAATSSPRARPPRGTPLIRTGTLERGLIAPLLATVLLTEEEIFGQRGQTRKKRIKKARAPLEDLRALAPGDYVIHSEHGVGRYLGLENRAVAGAGRVELLIVEYQGGKLYLPVYRLNQIEKHAGETPKLDRLGGTTFAKTKAKARAKAREMADDLLRLYAERNAMQKRPLPPPDDDYAAFEAAFPYEETADQAGAILDVQGDLSETKVMDRLVCGDVGFGKTEVALRAAFRVASAGRQVAVLCPTTVLTQQHFLTFQRRFAGSAFEVRALSRFQSKAEMSDTLKRLAAGTVDVVVGTHRVLSKDVRFKELGLVVIDEEQRFGVVHKERLKKLRTEVDVLTLTATPIPRTLQLALGGLREVSYISTPPADRRAIRTVVARFDEAIVKEAIERELGRGGQVYYVYNRVEGLYERANRLQALLPQARIAVGHGQMRETQLEKTMLGFVEGDYDVLVATAIVESGLDIPRANTMIIDRADLMGLAQLYQLRGRVGRSELRAYCYLLVPPPSEMSPEAQSRIEALERYTELGSGFRIATLDMEIRGAGDLLGAEQSGVVQSVGLELFCTMLQEATAELRGEEVVHDIDPELNFDVEALLPESYIDEVGVRLSLYKRLASATDEHDVTNLADEMENRFGRAPTEAVNLVELMRIKTELRKLKVLVCEAVRGSVSLRFRADTPLDAGKLAALVATERAKYKLSPDGRLTRKAKETEQHYGSIGLCEKMLEELGRV
jgi:transcription-repair coupling factor (superfamily II helicase)